MLFVFLLVAQLLWYAGRSRRWLLLPLSCVATAAAFGIAGWSAPEEQQRYARLREQFPYESMEERLPAARAAFRPEQLPDAAAQRLARLEASPPENPGAFRVYVLRHLHENTASRCANSPALVC